MSKALKMFSYWGEVMAMFMKPDLTLGFDFIPGFTLNVKVTVLSSYSIYNNLDIKAKFSCIAGILIFLQTLK